jgi:pimeloyl-ACP methyl ester carboxylesterase
MVGASDHEITLADGRTLAYIEFGSARGRPILHCHGAPSARVEGPLVLNPDAATDLGVRVIVPDRPGLGRSDFQPGRRIVDWPHDVAQLADALGIETFAVLGSSGGSPYALACGVGIPNRIRRIGLLGGIAPLDAPGVLDATSSPIRMMLRMARFAPAALRALFRLNLRAMRGGADRTAARMAASFPEPDRILLQQPDIRDGFIACFQEACRQGPRGAVWDLGLIARPWGFDPASLNPPLLLWHGELDRNVPPAHGRYLASVIQNCRATFYPGEAHLSTFVHHHREILSALAA